MKQQTIKLIGIIFILLIIADLILFITNKISTYLFWVIVIISAIVAYKILPKLKTN